MGGGARKFCVQGNINAVKYKEIFPLFHAQKIWLGASPIGDSYFYVPSHLPCNSKTTKYDDNGRLMKQVRTARWYTNIDHESRHEPYDLSEKYSSAVYPKYDNYNAIEVTKSADIPYDYDGVMGVPTTFLDRLCPEQFEIIDLLSAPKCEEYRNRNPENKDPFARLLIRNLAPGAK